MKSVDSGIKEIVALIENFYDHDNKTAYVFTSDHGMGNRGSHGDGHPDNTRTPLVAWGAGVAGPNTKNPSGHDEFSQFWKLSHLRRNDVNQADVTPLMATLIGIPIPVNSVGVLPIDYLDDEKGEWKAKALLTNAKQILDQYLVKLGSYLMP